ncbi:MAG: GNAT family N-acetyltransferase [Lachnospiraceae bacterium]|nr:GNAT family N-acetyltransferase [Candidatus Equihabitans merdae]
MDLNEIKVIEDLSLNAWPSHQMQMYDGWILRFSYYYTCRTNCVEEIGLSSLPIPEKVDYCERIYHRWQTPCIFKSTPLTNPLLKEELESRGYGILRPTDVMVCNLEGITAHPENDLTIENQVSYAWLQGLFDLNHTDNIVHRRIVPSMYAAIPKNQIAISITDHEKVIATGLGILDRDYIGVYAIHVNPSYRRRHMARDIVSTLLVEGRKAGAKYAYLQCLSDNAPAKNLYQSLGFKTKYEYCFLAKEV